MKTQNISSNFSGKSIISLEQFDKKTLQILFRQTDKLKKLIIKKKYLDLLKGKIVTLLFFEPSSRTFSSFAAAAKKLGSQTIEFQNPMQTSSAAKGETLEDAIRVFENYCDAIIMRHPQIGAARRAAESSLTTPIINAGDGSGEHPTQALMDLYTIHNRFGKLTDLKGLLAGDLLYGRTVHSLLKGLSLFSNNTIYLLSPAKLKLSKDVYQYATKKGVKLIEIASDKDIPADCHFWYWTRVQKERFTDIKEYERLKNKFIITPELVKEKGNKKMIIMHPLPRVGEIDVRIDDDKRAIYLTEQLKNGLYVRMALLTLILK